MASSRPSPQGACYKFTVESADQAAAVIRERLGPNARVLSVRTVEATGLSRLWASPRLEVIARADEDAPEPQSAPGSDPRVESFPHAAAAKAPSLPALLRRAGVSEIGLARLQSDPGWGEIQDLPLHRALVEAGVRLNLRRGRGVSKHPVGRAAFLSTSGAGRTTAMCKWLGLEVFRNRRTGSVVSVEFDKPNATGVLPMFCEAMGVPFVRSPGWVVPELTGEFAFFDMPAMSLRDQSDNDPIAEFLNREGIRHRILVLNAAYDPAILRSAFGAGRALGATHLVFTHMDEVPQWGRVWEYVGDGALEPLFLSTGPALTGECIEDVWGTVIRRTLASSGSARDDATVEEESARAEVSDGHRSESA
jgi:flagellar biosynthesis protein FlhF